MAAENVLRALWRRLCSEDEVLPSESVLSPKELQLVNSLETRAILGVVKEATDEVNGQRARKVLTELGVFETDQTEVVFSRLVKAGGGLVDH